MGKHHVNTLLLALLLFITSCGTAQEETYFPGRAQPWESLPSEYERSVDRTRLEAAVQFARENEYSGPRDLRLAILQGFSQEPFHEILGPVKKRGGPAGIVLKNGYVLAEWGDVDRVDMAFSVTKSFLSTTAGLALDRGLIRSLTDTVVNYVWDGTFRGEHNERIQWKHLLEQNSAWTGSLWGLHDWADRPPETGDIDDWKFRRPVPPGTEMEYNDVRVNVLAYALTHVWRRPLPEVLRVELMDPIGCSSTWRWFGYDHAWTVIDGLQMKSVTGGGHSGGGMWISSRDMARFGLLYMNNGVWDKQRLLSADWISMATTPSATHPRYGLLWWLNQSRQGPWTELPANLFYAAGFGGNYIVIDREKQLVVVCRWLDPSELPEFLIRLYKALP